MSTIEKVASTRVARGVVVSTVVYDRLAETAVFDGRARRVLGMQVAMKYTTPERALTQHLATVARLAGTVSVASPGPKPSPRPRART